MLLNGYFATQMYLKILYTNISVSKDTFCLAKVYQKFLAKILIYLKKIKNKYINFKNFISVLKILNKNIDILRKN